MKLAASSHIDIDVAIEIINEMIADAYVYINEIDYSLGNLGLSFDDDLAETEHKDLVYEKKLLEVAQYRKEIIQIYNGTDVESILYKVEKKYAPFLRQKHTTIVKIPV